MMKILCIFCLVIAGASFAEVSGEVEILRQELTEAREVSAMRREDISRLEGENASLERELDEIRRRYASLLIATDQSAVKAMELDLEASALVRGTEGNADVVSDTRNMLEILGFCRRKISELETAMTAHRENINAILDAIQASDATRDQAAKTLTALKASLDECLEILELSTSQEMIVKSASCAVVKLDATTQIAILDQGSIHGVRQGQELTMQRDGEVVARMKIIIVRPRNSAAVLTEGDFNLLACGALLRKE